MKNFFSQVNNSNIPKGVYPIVGAGLAGFWIVSNCIYKVEPGQGAIKFNYLTGLSNTVYTEGFKFKIPYIEEPTIYNLRNLRFSDSISAQNRDMQEIWVNFDIFYRPEMNKLDQIQRNLGTDYANIAIKQIVKEIVRGAVAQYDAQQLISQRDQLSNQVRSAVDLRLRQYNILIENCTISGITFSNNYQTAVDNKSRAQQDAARAHYVVDQSEHLKKTLIQKGQLDAKGIKLIGEQVKQDPAFMELQKISFAVDLSEIVAKSRNKVLVNTSMLLLDTFATERDGNNPSK